MYSEYFGIVAGSHRLAIFCLRPVHSLSVGHLVSFRQHVFFFFGSHALKAERCLIFDGCEAAAEHTDDSSPKYRNTASVGRSSLARRPGLVFERSFPATLPGVNGLAVLLCQYDWLRASNQQTLY